MKITPITVQAFEIRDVPDLDPIRVILQDLGPGKGRVTIESYGQAWGCFWGGMGERTVGQFLVDAGTDYLIGKLARSTSEHEVDQVGDIIAVVKRGCREFVTEEAFA